jgi:hypothetical protein
MAQKTVVELLDDIDGQPADETLAFSLDGITYEIDLSSENADTLRKALSPYLDRARKARAASTGRARRSGHGPRTVLNRERSADIRAWAKQHGIEISDRGRIPAGIVDAYEANDPSKVKADKKVPEVAFQPAG